MKRAALLSLVFFCLAGSRVVRPEEANHYWELGWGLYYGEGLDAARFDWSVIRPDGPGVLPVLNEILRLNPKHKFLIRLWPIIDLGDCPQNRNQATLFHYLYAPGVRGELLARIKQQIDLILKGVSSPENVYGCCFLEELPGHFTDFSHVLNWRKGDPLPWDMKRFQKEIEAELGEPIDLGKRDHVLWWGRKYTQVIGEINRAMKEASHGRVVFYYQEGCYYTLDHLEAPGVKNRSNINVIPIHYSDIIKPGFCDGIFGYPNKEAVWEDQTKFTVNRFRCLLFSQVSLPPGMRLCRLDEMVELSRWRHPGNVGTFLFAAAGRKEKAWNQLAYQDKSSFWTWYDHVRRFGWDRKIGLDVVDRTLIPEIKLIYDLTKARKNDFVPVRVEVVNRRDSSWYAGDAGHATLRDVTVALKIPAGFSLPVANNPAGSLKIGDLPPGAIIPCTWWVLKETTEPGLPAGSSFSVAVTAANAPCAIVSSGDPERTIPSFQTQQIVRSGDRWVEPLYNRQAQESVAILTPLTKILCPEIGTPAGSVVYRESLYPGQCLAVGPGPQARLFSHSLFDEVGRRFPAGSDGVATFSEGYLVHRSPKISVLSGKKYRVFVTGWGENGGNALVNAHFTGRDSVTRERTTKDVHCLAGLFDSRERTVSAEIEVPPFLDDKAVMSLFFYRYQSTGTVRYKSFDFRPADIPDDGADVSTRLQGCLPRLEPPFTEWTYRDLSDPDPYGKPKLEIRFLPPGEMVR